MIKLTMLDLNKFDGMMLFYVPSYNEIEFQIEKVSDLWFVKIQTPEDGESQFTSLEAATSYIKNRYDAIMFKL